MAIKGQKFKSYTEEDKKEAIRLHIEEKWTYKQITEHLGIQDKDRVKKWMRKYRELGEFGLLDQRGRREQYLDQDRYVKQLKRENEALKKCLKIWKQEVLKASIASFKQQQSSIQ
ncbi:transposase [Paenibacillus macerans]|uniref:transposase n=1 Tax=Paenibacillus macerans TaxID=44252 RepID=UPI003D32394F